MVMYVCVLLPCPLLVFMLALNWKGCRVLFICLENHSLISYTDRVSPVLNPGGLATLVRITTPYSHAIGDPKLNTANSLG